jgi:lysophospholipid acyltransferase (LPLAT)-like uncharacterized protein
VRAAPGGPPRRRPLLKRAVSWLVLRFAPPLAAWMIRLIGRSLRLGTEGAEHVDAVYDRGGRIIIAFWHARQLMMPLAYRGDLAYVLISRHRDGELISRIVERFGLRSVRGSTARGGVEALRRLIRLGRSGVDLVVTPDGPRGPREVAQMGVVQLARATGLPIVPLAFGCSKKKSSRAGTGSSCPGPSAAPASSGGRRSGCRARWRATSWRRSGWRWSRRSAA